MDTPARWAGISPSGTTHYLCELHHTLYGSRYRDSWIMQEREVSRRLAGLSPFGDDTE